MRQYLGVKADHPDAIVLFRLGDFYEMFFEDAVIGAAALDLTLTSRDKNKADPVPMCGVPHHAVRGYINRLIDQGKKVVLCEQTEDPRFAKGLVKREVTQVITPGIVVDDGVLDPSCPRYVACVVGDGAGAFGLAYLDVSTGELRATEEAGIDALCGELCRANPREVLLSGVSDRARAHLTRRYPSAYQVLEDAVMSAAWAAQRDAALAARTGNDRPLARAAAAEVVAYARATQPRGTLPITEPTIYEAGDAVVLGDAAIANLELCQTLMGNHKAGSLLAVIDATVTAPGARALRRRLLYPLTDLGHIRRRQDAVAALVERPVVREAVRDQLAQIADLERIAGRVLLATASPRDLGSIRTAAGIVPELSRTLAGVGGRELALDPAVLATLADLEPRLSASLADKLPATLADGGVIREGYDDELDEQRRLSSGAKDEILAIETDERERTGIASLKVKHNRVFGYYIEVTKAQLARVPERFIRKQTIATGERYVTPELATLEARVAAADDAARAREAALWNELCAAVAKVAHTIAEAGRELAAIDCTAALAEVAHKRGYVRPVVDDGAVIDITDGRHPVIESLLLAGRFVPNDCLLDSDQRQVLILTGPNMGGKSTYMRQVAHVVILAQMGAFVPAAAARIGVVDRIFTRVGAADNLSRGDSTFMVEMRETAAICTGATARSLVLLDEVGRGTATFDGMSIAWAVAEYLHDAVGARTLLSTHYHELCQLADTRPRMANVSVAIAEHGGDIVFLHRVVAGGASQSYGIDVARLAGMPDAVVARARDLLSSLEAGDGPLTSSPPAARARPRPAPAKDLLRSRLRAIDPTRTTPMDALAVLAELCALAAPDDESAEAPHFVM
ncbi:MAG TPA: DNA mismatch repair protein MutS [Kofleriaceae bacterium]|nr:DNA mismatch repair protein MutS [Kofleriaceae bacterium]